MKLKYIVVIILVIIVALVLEYFVFQKNRSKLENDPKFLLKYHKEEIDETYWDGLLERFLTEIKMHGLNSAQISSGIGINKEHIWFFSDKPTSDINLVCRVRVVRYTDPRRDIVWWIAYSQIYYKLPILATEKHSYFRALEFSLLKLKEPSVWRNGQNLKKEDRILFDIVWHAFRDFHKK